MQAKKLQEYLSTWFEESQRSLPWRKTYHPYMIWICEVMLQQTQILRGVQYFERWIERFPSVTDVAQASIDEIYRYWEGLGYYNRARNIHRTAKILVEQYNGRIPCDYDILRTLPGIGDYTATALMSIAFEKPFAVLDANVLRVLSRIYGISHCIQKTTTRIQIQERMQTLLCDASPRIINQAVMELGEVICLKNPLCSQCPVATLCFAHKNNQINSIPYKSQKPKRIAFDTIAFALYHNNTVFMRKRSASAQLWADFWEFPEYRVQHKGFSKKTLLEALSLLYQEYPMLKTIHDITTLSTKTIPDFQCSYNYTIHTVSLHLIVLNISNDVLISTYTPKQETSFTMPHNFPSFVASSGHKKIQKFLSSLS